LKFDIAYIAPEIILALGGMIVLAIGLTSRERTSSERVGLISPETLTIATLVAALVPTIWLFFEIGKGKWQFGGIFAVDGLALFFKIIALVSTAIVALMSVDFFQKTPFHRSEYCALLIFSALAISTVAASSDFIMIYLALEFLSIVSYVLAGYLKRDTGSSEGSLKYFLYGSVAAGIMVYGMSMIYGLTGTTNLTSIGDKLLPLEGQRSSYYGLLLLSTVMILVGLGFKIAMVPFHQWAPDTYEGAPTPITAYLSVGSKAAGFAVLVRLFATCIPPTHVNWLPIIIVLSALTMTVGNLIAIVQVNIKRMLAYSSIAQAGYILIGVAAMAYKTSYEYAMPAVLLYIFIYLFMNLGAFAVVSMLSVRLQSNDIEDYAGLIRRAPVASVALTIFLLSLAGIPPTAGLLAKWYLFMAALKSESTALLWLTIVAIANTVVSVYYYMNVARMMFFVKPKDTGVLQMSHPLNMALILTLVMTLGILIYPPPFLALAHTSAHILGIQP